MNAENISQVGTSVAFFLIIADLVAQLLKLHRAKTSYEISLVGLGIRILGVSLFWFRFVVIKDTVFLVGQSFFLFLLFIYTFLALKYRKTK